MDKNSETGNQQPVRYKKMTVKKCDVFCSVFGIATHLGSIYADLSLARDYYYDGHTIFCYLTFILVALSAFVSSVISLYFYWIDGKKKKYKASKKVWMLRMIFLLFGIAPVLRNIDSLYFALKSYQSKNKTEKRSYARRMIFEINDGSFLKLFEAFLKSCPQLVLQIYICLHMQYLSPNVLTGTEILQYCSMLISAISVSGSVVVYWNSLRESLDDKNEFRWFQLPIFFLWRFFEVISRAIAMALGISTSAYFSILFVVHFIIMIIWIHFMKTDFTEHSYAERFYNALLSVILTFVFFNAEDTPTHKRCTYFYLGMCMENTILVAAWYYKNFNTLDLRIQLPAAYVQLFTFCLSIMLMVIHYKFCHPTVGTLFKQELQESNELNCNAPEPAEANAEANAMLEPVQNDKAAEIAL